MFLRIEILDQLAKRISILFSGLVLIGLFFLVNNNSVHVSGIFINIIIANATADMNEPKEEMKSSTLIGIVRGKYTNQTELSNLYRPYLTESDYVFAKPDDRNFKHILDLPGKKGVEYFSLDEIKKNTALLKTKGATFISYDLERAYSPSNDMADPINSITAASKIVHQNGMEFVIAPGPRLTDRYGSSFAPYAEIYIIQAMMYQRNPIEYESYVTNITNVLKEANPSIKVITELSTFRGSLQNMQQSFSSVADIVDGVALWYGFKPDHLIEIKEFLNWLRE
jgi:hypothetical protein